MNSKTAGLVRSWVKATNPNSKEGDVRVAKQEWGSVPHNKKAALRREMKRVVARAKLGEAEYKAKAVEVRAQAAKELEKALEKVKP